MYENGTDDSENLSMATRKSIQGIALDMDGLLFDTERLYWQVGDRVLQRRGKRYCTELQQRMMGRIGLEAVAQMIDFHQLADEPQALLDESDDVFFQLVQSDLTPMPGLDRWIEFLIQVGIPFGLATSSRRRFVDHVLASVPWSEALAFVLTGDDVTHGKPHPEMYRSAASKLAIDPQSMLVLEDSGNGCAAGVAAGAQVVAIPSIHTQNHDFTGVILQADSLTDPSLWNLLKPAAV